MLSQSVGVGKLREAGFRLERGSAEDLERIERLWKAVRATSYRQLREGGSDVGAASMSPDASGDDVHDALPSGCSAPDHQDGGADFVAVLLERGGP